MHALQYINICNHSEEKVMSEEKDIIRSSASEERGVRQRYNLTIPPELNAELQRISQERNIPVPELIRHFIKLGLIEDQLGPFVYTDENGKRIEVELFPQLEDDQKLRLWKNTDSR
jgi:hypothetical protein